MTDRDTAQDEGTKDGGADPERRPAGEGPERRRVRGKPGTEQAKEGERERDRTGASTGRASTPADEDEQTDFSGVEKKLEEPFREKKDAADDTANRSDER